MNSDRQRDSNRARFFHYLDKGMYPLMLLAKYAFGYIVFAFYVDAVPEPGIFDAVHDYPEVTVMVLAFTVFLVAGDAARYHKNQHWDRRQA